MESIYKFGLSVCLFVSNKRQNGWTDRAHIFCGISRDLFYKIRELFFFVVQCSQLIDDGAKPPKSLVYTLCLPVCPFVSRKRQNGWTDRAQIFWGTSRRFIHQIRFLKILKINEIFFIKSTKFCLFLFYNVHTENMFTIEIEDGRETLVIWWCKSLIFQTETIWSNRIHTFKNQSYNV